MAFERTDPDQTWIAEDGRLKCPQLIQAAVGDAPYVNMDFSMVLDEDVKVSSITVTEVASKTITITDESVSDNGRVVSFKLASFAAGDFEMNVAASLSSGTTQTRSKRGDFRAIT